MKKLFFFSMLTLIFGQLNAQDLIVTTKGDSLNCKITKVKSDNIYFTFTNNGNTFNSLLPMSNVDSYQYGNQSGDGNVSTPSSDYQKVAFSVTGGYSRRLAKVADNLSSDYEDYIKQLKNGYHMGADLAYYFSENYGAGIKFITYKASNSGNFYVENYGRADIKDEITMPFIGPMFSMRYQNEKNSFLLNYAVGYYGYIDNWTIEKTYGTNKGGTAGLMFDIDYSYWFAKNTALDIRLAFISGTLSSFTRKTGSSKEKVKLEKDQYEGLGRMDISVGLRFGK